ncbi:MAG: hypothetical protein J6V09_02460 [Clostridia bacterium]|nr:hypothetical protein [Clostridia bacterium]
MKLVKKILVGIVVASLLTCCFALSTSAGGESLGSTAQLAEAYEYVLPVHFANDFEGLIPAGQSSFTIKRGTIRNNSLELGTSAAGNNGLTEVIDDGTGSNAAVKVYYTGTGQETCKFYTKAAGFGTPTELVVTYRVMVESQTDADGNPIGGSKVEIMCNSISMFAMDFSDPASTKYTYSHYDNSTYSTAEVADKAPAFNTWYTIEGIFNYETGAYSVNVVNEADNAASFIISDSLGGFDDVTDARIVLSDKVAKATTWFDDVCFYEGTFVRDVYDQDAKINAYVMQADAIANAAGATVEDRAEVADFYNHLFNELGYAPVEGTANYDKVKAIYDVRDAFFNEAYTGVLNAYATALESGSVGGYHERVAACEYIADVSNYYPADKDSLLLLPGITDEMADAIISSKAKIAQANELNERIKQESNRYVELVAGFNFATDNYLEMSRLIAALADCTNVDPTYKYAEENGILPDAPGGEYVTASVAIEKCAGLSVLVAEIDANVNIFTNAISAMPDPTAPDFDVTVNFANTYENFLTAATVYKNGKIHESLNVLTHPESVTLLALMEKYDTIATPINETKNICETFITLVIQAENASSYKYRLEAVEAAAAYVSTVLDDYAGVAEAKAAYTAIQSRLSADLAAATSYKNAVAAIDIDASYSALKAAVSAARELKAAGNVVGIEGVQEANEVFARAEAKVTSLEGNSSTLIEAVNALKEATSFAERRELIAIANNAKDGAEDTISGVSAAKAQLETEISKLNSDVAAINAAFAQAISGAADVAAATAPGASTYRSADIVKDFVN